MLCGRCFPFSAHTTGELRLTLQEGQLSRGHHLSTNVHRTFKESIPYHTIPYVLKLWHTPMSIFKLHVFGKSSQEREKSKSKRGTKSRKGAPKQRISHRTSVAMKSSSVRCSVIARTRWLKQRLARNSWRFSDYRALTDICMRSIVSSDRNGHRLRSLRQPQDWNWKDRDCNLAIVNGKVALRKWKQPYMPIPTSVNPMWSRREVLFVCLYGFVPCLQ